MAKESKSTSEVLGGRSDKLLAKPKQSGVPSVKAL